MKYCVVVIYKNWGIPGSVVYFDTYDTAKAYSKFRLCLDRSFIRCFILKHDSEREAFFEPTEISSNH